MFGASGATDVRHDIYKLDIVADDVLQRQTSIVQSQEAIADGTFLEYRNDFNHILDLVNNPTLVTLSSTAINFDESDYAIHS